MEKLAKDELEKLVDGGLELPAVVEPTGDAALDEAVARLQQR